MPKQKTSKAAKKRFKVTATGKLLRRPAMRSHLLEKKSAKRKRGFRRLSEFKSQDRRAKEQVEHSLVYAYRDRKAKKRTFRRLWILRINAAARQNGLSYNQFVAGLKKADIALDRKVLADLAVSDPPAFAAIAEQAKAALGTATAKQD